MPTTTTTSTVTLGKDVAITGVNNARTCTITSSANEIDVTKLGDSSRKFRRGLVEQTCEVECVDSPGVTLGATFQLSGTTTGNASYVCTAIKINSPLDGIQTYTVSGSRSA